MFTKLIAIFSILLITLGCNQKLQDNKKINSEFNVEQDIKDNNIHLIRYGLELLPPNDFHLQKKLDSLALVYNFKWENHGCSPPDSEGMILFKEYNEKIIEYLSTKNGKDWYKKYSKSVDSLFDLLEKKGNPTIEKTK